jgi:hypothetical protein
VDEDDFDRYVQAEGGTEHETLSDFLLWSVYAYKDAGGMFQADITNIRTLRKQLNATFPVHVVGPEGSTYEGDGIFARVKRAACGESPVLQVSVHSSFKRQELPRFLRRYLPRAYMRMGIFANIEDLAE